MKRSLLWCLALCWLVPFYSMAQDEHRSIIQDFLNQEAPNQAWSKADVAQWTISSQHQSRLSGTHYLYLKQTHQGIPVANGTATIAIKDGAVQSMGDRLLVDLHRRAPNPRPSIAPIQAIQQAATALGLPTPKELVLQQQNSTQQFTYSTGGISQVPIPVQLMYFETQEGTLHLVWNLSVYQLDGKHWWSVKIDAQTGGLIDQKDWVISCSFDHGPTGPQQPHRHLLHTFPEAPEQVQQPDQYTVYALPVESPNHGVRTVVTNPADPLASPYGWHDTNAVAGAELTITAGNNVFAYEDTASLDVPGYSPNGGAVLEFNFPIPPNPRPDDYLDAAITNLFYMNNMMHDIWYHHGFDEGSGNFQYNNYGRGGIGLDFVEAQAQDGSGTNNANMATPPDGFAPRMQMYLWNVPAQNLTVNSPANVAGGYLSAVAGFGPRLTSVPVTGDLALIEDITPPINDGCDALANTNILGRIAVIDRGGCFFDEKVNQAEVGGAIAAIIVNNQPGSPFGMGPGAGLIISIPAIMISQADGNILKAAMLNGTVNASLDDAGGLSQTDSDFDNGIIAHEYGHGITNRLVGGGMNVNCLFNQEQMGEGWSDWFALMLTIEPGDRGPDRRGIATYSRGDSVLGQGIRPAPYSTDFAVNNYTYDDSNDPNISQPHGVGFIYATALWDLNWALIDFYGGTPDPDLYTGTGGNNVAMRLVTESLKLLPCEPGMIDGRDAVLLADAQLYNGTHRCLIWETFARRGFGFSASQGSPQSRSDQVEAFDLPLDCQVVTAPPVAAFSSSATNTCLTTISFTDSSTAVPQSWLWRFGDGDTSTVRNPTHTYAQGGNYTVTLIVTNTLGTDSTTQQINIVLPTPPMASDVVVCSGDTALLTASASGTVRWLDGANTVVHEGPIFVVPNVTAAQTYYLENVVTTAPQFVGPVDPTIGLTSIHSFGAYAMTNFNAMRPLEIVSAYVEADGAGPRTFFLVSGSNIDGSPPNSADIIDRVIVNLVDGGQRVDLNFQVPAPGTYNIGGRRTDLIYNITGARYPYTLPNYMSITGSSNFNNASAYHYFYNIAVRDPACVSDRDSVQITPILADFNFTTANLTANFTDASNGATSWAWDFGDSPTATSTAQNPSHTYSSPGTYTVTLTINGTCTQTQTVTIRGNAVNTISDDAPTIQLLPNPARDQTTLLLSRAVAEDLSIDICDATGKRLMRRMLNEGTVQVNLSIGQLPAGVYLVNIQGGSFYQTKKLVVE